MYSVVIPVYGNADSLPDVIAALTEVDRVIRQRFSVELEAVFVVDASPDQSYDILKRFLPLASFPSKLLLHARNFGSFAAIRTGLRAGTGPYFGMIAADLQEPPELLVSFLAELMSGQYDVVVGNRLNRDDPTTSRFMSNLFWGLYRKFVIPEIPRGGIDLFGCNEAIRGQLLNLEEANTSLVGLVFWLGFRRKEVGYERRLRKYGKSAWTFRKKLRYLIDSVFAFTDLPIRLLTVFGILGLVISSIFGMVVLVARLLDYIREPGYAALIITIMFFGALNVTGIGIVGAYVWRSYENTKRRPFAIVCDMHSYPGTEPQAAPKAARTSG
jgi:glycosyltransferase involved in cell wall biosynthesis